jgi:serine/threonine protein kinase
MIGKRIGPYEIVEEIGKGGMATVYRAYQPNLDRYVAVKIINRAIALDAASLERFQREARLLTRLVHPHLLPIYDYDATHDPAYIVMRYLDSGTLKGIIDKGILPHEEIIYMLRQLASALDYAHRNNVIHRDIKPSNVMLDEDGNAFLTDFGIARTIEAGQDMTQSGYALGTPGYMSPEQGMGVDGLNSRADIYSLGVMTFQMLTGKMPYTGETPLSIIFKHISDPIPDITAYDPQLSPATNAVIARVLAKQPEDR